MAIGIAAALDEAAHGRSDLLLARGKEIEVWMRFEETSLARRQSVQLETGGVPDADLADIVEVAADLELREGAVIELEVAAEHRGELANANGVPQRNGVLVRDSRRQCANRAKVLTLKGLRHLVDGCAETSDLVPRLDVRAGREITGGDLLGGKHQAVRRDR